MTYTASVPGNEFLPISCFSEFLSPAARKVYTEVWKPGARLVSTVRYLYTLVDLEGRREPGAEQVSQFAEIYNHGVKHNIIAGQFVNEAEWKRLQTGSDRAILCSYIYSSLAQRALSDIYNLGVDGPANNPSNERLW